MYYQLLTMYIHVYVLLKYTPNANVWCESFDDDQEKEKMFYS